MPKRKTQSGDDLDGDQSIPLPIQTFFWRQTSPFIRPKLEKLCDASCVTFERVVVQNILHGLSPSLCEAISSVSRWKVIQAAFPHVMHACAALLSSRKQTNMDAKFTNNETKLLYTLHWIILDAASECEDLETEMHHQKNGSSVKIHSLNIVQLFVYLMAPIIHSLRDTDFQSLKLENGLRLWQPLWDYRQPDIPCFATPVKVQKNILKAQRSLLKVNTNAANIYIGKGTSRENLFEMISRRQSECPVEGPPSPMAPLARMSDICAFSVSESMSATYDIMCENCDTVMKSNELNGSCRCCGRKDSFVAFLDTKMAALQKLQSPVDKDYVKQKLASAVTSGIRGPTAPDILSASYFDIAVMKNLFCLHWSEDGIYWALYYMHQRLLEVCDEYSHLDISERERSRSLPLPELNILQMQSMPSSPENTFIDADSIDDLTTLKSSTSKSNNVPTVQEISQYTSSSSDYTMMDGRKEPPFKRIRVIELKQFFDSGRALLKKRDSNLDNDESETQSPRLPHNTVPFFARFMKDDSSSSCTLSTLDTDTDTYHKPCATVIEKNREPRMGLSNFSDHESLDSSSQNSSQESSDISQIGDLPSVKKPIITITEDSPDPTATLNIPSFYSGQNIGSETDGYTENCDQNGLPRSLTDSNIYYRHENDVAEVSGSVFYIQENGHINYKVVLRAVHFIAMNQRSEHICEVLLNILNCLLDLDIVEHKKDNKTSRPSSTSSEKKEEKSTVKETKIPGNDDITAHGLAMESLTSIYKALGCPHGCGDGLRGHHSDHLRLKGHNCLQRLQDINPVLFRKYLCDTVKKYPVQETVDFLHALLGFCIDPSILMQSSQG
ncbi:hypothetical protein ScPMuIL_011569 [Solemya velum]